MMAFHFLDPDREPRACENCTEGADLSAGYYERCVACRGTGRLGVEGAEPDVEIIEEPESDLTSADQWYYTINPQARPISKSGGPFPTESAALEAARNTLNSPS